MLRCGVIPLSLRAVIANAQRHLVCFKNLPRKACVQRAVAAVVGIDTQLIFLRGAGHDIDNTAHGQVAPQTGGATAANDLDALNRIFWDTCPIDRAKKRIIKRDTIHHHQGVDVCTGAKTTNTKGATGWVQ